MKIQKTKNQWTLRTSSVRLRLAPGANAWGYDLEARSGGKWRMVAACERNTARLGADTINIGPVLLQKDRLPLVFTQEPARAQRGRDCLTVTLAGSAGPHTMTQRLILFDDEPRVHVRADFDLRGRPRVASLGTGMVFLPGGDLMAQYKKPDFAWIPTLRRDSGHVVADQIFRAPAAIVQSGPYAMALVPDLDALAIHRPLPACLDLQFMNERINAPWLWYGFRTYANEGHVYFRHDPDQARPVKHNALRYEFDLLLDADAPALGAHRFVNRFLWHRYGHNLIKNFEPQAAPMDVFARHACQFAFETGKIYHEFEHGGKLVGGTRNRTTTARTLPQVMDRRALRAAMRVKRLLPLVHGFATERLMTTPAANDLAERLLHASPPPDMPSAWFQAWMNNLRTAYGFFAHGTRAQDAGIMEKARRIKELLLSAPINQGLWPSLCYFPGNRVSWYEGSQAFEAVHWYHLPDNAWTGIWMLNWHQDLEPDPRLLDRAVGLGDFLCRAQAPDGSIPSWVRWRNRELVVRNTLKSSAQTAAPGLFLARLAEAAADPKYLEKAILAADFLIDRVMPGNLWFDYETFFSCSKKDLRMRDAGTGLPPMNNLCVFWTCELLRHVYALTGEERYAQAGLRALDLLCLWQQVWDAPWVSINTYGGFGVMNTDAEWNDARQSMFAETLMGWFDITGESEYMERGIAALRASFTLMLCPENQSVAPGNQTTLRPHWHGATYENFAHLGFDRRVPGYVLFDWGSGGALAAAARARQTFGDVFLHAASGALFGIDGCTASGLELSLGRIAFSLETLPGHRLTPLIFRTRGLNKARRKIVVNGQPAGTMKNPDKPFFIKLNL